MKAAKAAAPAKQTIKVPAQCEPLRPVVNKYFKDLTDEALFVASKESGCSMAEVSSTQDYCAFQIHKEPATADSVDLCVRRAYEKYQDGRLNSHNWSAWYSVCTPKGIAKFPNLILNCI